MVGDPGFAANVASDVIVSLLLSNRVSAGNVSSLVKFSKVVIVDLDSNPPYIYFCSFLHSCHLCDCLKFKGLSCGKRFSSGIHGS